MKERTLIYVVVVLVVVNIAALGTILYQRVAHPFWGAQRIGQGMEGMPEGIGRLQLSPDQRQILKASRERTDSLVSPIHDEIKNKRRELVAELGSSQADTAKVNQLLTEIGDLQISVQKIMVHNFMENSKAFSPEQRKVFLRMIEWRAEWQERPMFGPGRGFGRDRHD